MHWVGDPQAWRSRGPRGSENVECSICATTMQVHLGRNRIVEFLDVTSAAVVFKVASARIPKMSGDQLLILCIGNAKLMRSLILSLCENLHFFRCKVLVLLFVEVETHFGISNPLRRPSS